MDLLQKGVTFSSFYLIFMYAPELLTRVVASVYPFHYYFTEIQPCIAKFYEGGGMTSSAQVATFCSQCLRLSEVMEQ